MAGRYSKYETHVKPHLEWVNEQVRNGVTEEAIAAALDISVASLNNYRNQHKEFKEALRRDKGKEILGKLINAGIEAACGKWVEEERIVVQLDDDGNPLKKQKEYTKKYIPANAPLNMYYTKFYGKEEGFTADPAEHELKRAKFELDKKIEELKNWKNLD